MSDPPRPWQAVLAEHMQVTSQLHAAGETLDAIAQTIIAALGNGRRLYIAGNGGSAADAQHIAAELVGRFRRERRALPAVALTTDTSTLTAVSNDLGYERVFARQIEALVRPGDVVWLLSTSGNSPNVLEAVRAATEKGATVIGFTGQTGGQLAGLCKLVFRTPHTASDRIQEAHQLAYHYLCERIEAAFQ